MVTDDALSRLSSMDKIEVWDTKVRVHHLTHLIGISPAKMQKFKDETAKDETLQLLYRQGWPELILE